MTNKDKVLIGYIIFFLLLITVSILMPSCNKKEELIIPIDHMNTTYDYLTNGGTAKVWKLDSTTISDNSVYTLDQGFYEADYTYYGTQILTITHPSYVTITLNYQLKQDSLIVYGLYAGIPAVLRFKIDCISPDHLQLTRIRFQTLTVTEYYIRK